MVPRFATLGRIPKGVWVLGGVSLLMDVSSEMIHSLLPLFMATTLGASVIIIGLIEGLAEATALILKVFSGAISDYVGKRKGLALLGYGTGALSKPLFAIAPTAGVVFSARMIDRVGKGIRGAPRDALVADVTRRRSAAPPTDYAGAGYRRRLSRPAAGGAADVYLGQRFSRYFLGGGHSRRALHSPARIRPTGPKSAIAHKRSNPLKRENLKSSPPPTGGWSRSAAFSPSPASAKPFWCCAPSRWRSALYHPAGDGGDELVYSLTAYPFGKLSDSMSHSKLLQWGLLVLILADIVLALSGHWSTLLIGVALWGFIWE